MVTQVAPFLLVGDIGERPDPAEMPVGYVFHVRGATTTYVVVISNAGVKSWDTIGGGGGGSTLLKWGANIQASDVGRPLVGPVHTLYLADQTDAAYVLNSPLGYPIRKGGNINGLSINVSSNTSSIEIDIELSINGVPVVVITVPAGTTGAQFQATDFPLNPQDLIDISATSADPAGTGAMQVTVVVDMTAN